MKREVREGCSRLYEKIGIMKHCAVTIFQTPSRRSVGIISTNLSVTL